jgi:hypothetical protein
MITSRRGAAFSAPSRLFDLNGETNRVRKKQSSAIIAADVRRFSYLINTDEVFGTHRQNQRIILLFRPLASICSKFSSSSGWLAETLSGSTSQPIRPRGMDRTPDHRSIPLG